MSLELVRIDERLLHGQVLVGWASRLEIDVYLIVDDVLSGSRWEQDLYRAGAPGGTRIEFLSVVDAIRRVPELERSAARAALLTRETSTMRRLAEAGVLEERRVNVGGIHAAPGRLKALDYVYLGPGESADLSAIEERVQAVSARDLPTSREVPLEELRRAAGQP